jgi:hypothetical protein
MQPSPAPVRHRRSFSVRTVGHAAASATSACVTFMHGQAYAERRAIVAGAETTGFVTSPSNVPSPEKIL